MQSAGRRRVVLSERTLARIAKNLALSAGALAVLFILAEITLRFVYQPENFGTAIRYDQRLGWSLDPNTSVRAVHFHHGLDYFIKINSVGLRDREIQIAKTPGRKRILFLGDSVVFGTGVDSNWRMSEFLGRALGDRCEVVNAGVPGWGPDQELMYLESEGAQLQPDLVVVVLTVANDVVNASLDHLFLGNAPKPRYVLQSDSLSLVSMPEQQRTAAPAGTSLRSLLKRSRLILFIQRRIERLLYMAQQRRDVEPFPQGFHRSEFERNYSHWSVYRREYDPEFESAWEVTERILSRFSRWCLGHGAELIIFSLPDRLEVDAGWREALEERAGIDGNLLDFDRPSQRMAACCRERGIAFVHPVQEFRDALTVHDLYFESDNHPNRYGHALTARVLLDELHERCGLEFHIADSDRAYLPGPPRSAAEPHS